MFRKWLKKRRPTSEKWFAFVPKVFLFGAVSAVIHYNCFAGIFSVLANKILGLPVFNYFDDFQYILSVF